MSKRKRRLQYKVGNLEADLVGMRVERNTWKQMCDRLEVDRLNYHISEGSKRSARELAITMSVVGGVVDIEQAGRVYRFLMGEA